MQHPSESGPLKRVLQAIPGGQTVLKMGAAVATSTLMTLGQMHGEQPQPPKKQDTPDVKTEEARAREALKSLGDRELAVVDLFSMKYDEEFRNANALERARFAELLELFGNLKKLDPAKDASVVIASVSKIKNLQNDLRPLLGKIREHQRKEREQKADAVRKRFRSAVEKPSPELLKQASDALVSLDTPTLFLQTLDLNLDIKLGKTTLSDDQRKKFDRMQTLTDDLSFLQPATDASLILKLAGEIEPLKKDLLPLFRKKEEPGK